MSETISVVVPTYNGARFIPACLDSLLSQSCPPDEIILVDDGSTDGTADFVTDSYPEVKLVRLDSNRGFAAAANAGIRSCRADYVALLNNDARADARWLAELKKPFGEDNGIGSCSSKMLFADRPEIVNSIGIGFTHAGTAFDVGYGQPDGERFASPREIFGACAGAAMYRRSLFEIIGLFDEDLFMWYEDADLSFRARLAGYKCRYIPAAIVYHVGGGTESPHDRKHVYYCSRNQVLVLVKNLPDSLRSRYFMRLLVVAAKHSIRSLLQGNVTVTAGYLGAVARLRLFLKKHKATRDRAIASDHYIWQLMNLESGQFSRFMQREFRVG